MVPERHRVQLRALVGTISVGLIAAGFATWLIRGDRPSTALSDLGLTLVGGGLALAVGGLVSYAVLHAERRLEAALRTSDHARERMSLQLALTTAPSLESINLEGRDLSGFVLRDKNMAGARLRCADLRNADLSDADLRWADLMGADLRGARLFRADLAGTSLARADLSDANLALAKLHAMYGSPSDEHEDSADLTGARYSASTVWPDGVEPEAYGAERIE